jgi:L-iditol 2-dehydrogenase
MKSEQSILVLGCGIAGLLQIKLAKARGAQKIIATDINNKRLEIAKKFGATATINAKKDVAKEVRKNNDGKLADLVILCAGAPSAVKQAFSSVAAGGTILFFAMTEPGVEIPFHLFNLWSKQITIVSTYAGAPEDIKKAIELISSKKVKLTDMISHRMPLTKAYEGFKLVAEAKDSIKVIIEAQK